MVGLRRWRVCALVPGMILAVAGLTPGAAAPVGAASVTIGQLGGGSEDGCFKDFDFVQVSVSAGPSYTVPTGVWNVTSWSTQAGDGPMASGSLQLEIWRPTSGMYEYSLVGISPVESTSASGTNTFPLTTPITVQGGDLLGLRMLTDGYACAFVGDTPTRAGVGASHYSTNAPTPDEVRTFETGPGSTLNLTATLEDATLEDELPALRVEKVVSGTSTSGFVEQVQCTEVAVGPVDAQAGPVDASLPFRADGSPDVASPPAGWTVADGAWQLADVALTGASCSVTETVTGGAASVSYACSWTTGLSDQVPGVGCPGASSGPSPTPVSVVFEGNGDVGVITVTNTFPAPPVAIAPQFTG